MECIDEWTRPKVTGMPDQQAKILVPASTTWLPDHLVVAGLEVSAMVRSPVCVCALTHHAPTSLLLLCTCAQVRTHTPTHPRTHAL